MHRAGKVRLRASTFYRLTSQKNPKSKDVSDITGRVLCETAVKMWRYGWDRAKFWRPLGLSWRQIHHTPHSHFLAVRVKRCCHPEKSWYKKGPTFSNKWEDLREFSRYPFHHQMYPNSRHIASISFWVLRHHVPLSDPRDLHRLLCHLFRHAREFPGKREHPVLQVFPGFLEDQPDLESGMLRCMNCHTAYGKKRKTDLHVDIVK